MWHKLKQKKVYLSITGVVLFLGGINILVAVNNRALEQERLIAKMVDANKNKLPLVKAPEYLYGLRVENDIVEEKTIESGVFFADMLAPFNISFERIMDLRKMAKPFFDTRNFRVNKPYNIAYNENDSLKQLKYLVYEINPVDFVIFDFSKPSDTVYIQHKEVKIQERVESGLVKSSLFESMTASNLSPQMAVELAEIFASSIDFYRVHKGDYFKLVFEDKLVEGESIGVTKIKAALFNHGNQDYYAFRFEQDGKVSYFDEKGNSARKAFLKSPLKFGRLSSGFSMKRFHPVQKRFKAHLGTDYAAPKGTPILSVGDGVVTESKYSAFNGNYVKIKHSKEIVTQYLHMTGFAKGMRPGRKVSQGEVIGYVGSTGLATGPHVCFRYWKNGKQVNHLKEKFATYTPISKSNRAAFESIKEGFMLQLDRLQIPGILDDEPETNAAGLGV